METRGFRKRGDRTVSQIDGQRQWPGDEGDRSRRPLAELSIHPFNLEIYGEPDGGLRDSLSQFGQQHPIVVDERGRILSGARRWKAAALLGWSDIETVTLRPPDDAWSRKYVLVANAYRAAKSDYVRKLEADAYLRLLKAGETTKDALRFMAEERGNVTDGYSLKAPTALASAVAGISRMTYSRFRYVLDGGAQLAIQRAERGGEIDAAQARALEELAQEQARRLKQGNVGAQTADRRIRRALSDAKHTRSMSEHDQERERALRAFEGTMKRAESFLKAIHDLEPEVSHLGEAQARALAGTLSELGNVAAELGRRQNGPGSRLTKELVQLPPLSLPAPVYDRLKRLAAARKCSMSTLLAQVLQDDVGLWEMSTRTPPQASPLVGYDSPAVRGSSAGEDQRRTRVPPFRARW